MTVHITVTKAFIVGYYDFLGDTKIVEELLKCGYRSLEAKNQEGQTAVHLACQLIENDILKSLISSGANVNCRDTEGNTPLHVSTYE